MFYKKTIVLFFQFFLPFSGMSASEGQAAAADKIAAEPQPHIGLWFTPDSGLRLKILAATAAAGI